MAKSHSLARLVPLNLLSYCLGRFVSLRFPNIISWLVNAGFVSLFKIDMEEAEKPMVEYKSIQDVFTRALKPGERPIQGDFVSPADGNLSQMGTAIDGKGVQAKGLDYDLKDLAFSDFDSSSSKDLVSFATVYLAPHNYHRVHSPVSGTISKIRYIPGELWPVNEPFVKWMPRLFNRNERLVFDITLPEGGVVHAVMVGALNVGKMSSPHLPDFSSNDYLKKEEKFERDVNIAIKAGDELGTFMLGSTVVLLLDSDAGVKFTVPQLSKKRKVRMGEGLLNP